MNFPAKWRYSGSGIDMKGCIYVLYIDAELRLRKVEYTAPGDPSPREAVYTLEGSEVRHTIRVGMDSREVRAVTQGLVSEIDARPQLKMVLERRVEDLSLAGERGIRT